jgi:hypothetical protein
MANKVRRSRTLNYFEWPTFKMQKYAAWTPSDNSYIETDLYRWTILARCKEHTGKIKIRYPTRFDLTCYEQNDTSEAYDTKNLKDYSIPVQILARAHALMTNLETERIFPGKANLGDPCARTAQQKLNLTTTSSSYANATKKNENPASSSYRNAETTEGVKCC